MGKTPITKIEQVQGYVARHFGIKVADLRDVSNATKYSRERKIAIFLASKLNTEFSNAQIANAFGYTINSGAGTISRYFNEIQNALATPVGKKTIPQIDLVADVWKIAQKAGIYLD